MTTGVHLDLESAQVVVGAPGSGPGYWAGAPSAVLDDGTWWLAYRIRHPLDAGRGVANILARSDDGLNFESVAEISRTLFGAESLERPALVPRPEGGWRLFVSCATPDSKHWWIEALDADRVEDLPGGQRTVVIAGSDAVAVKDPVVVVRDDAWSMWACEHPLTEPGEEDRMTTALYTSVDGLEWTRQGTVLAPESDGWDARGTRVTAVLDDDPLTVLYDGRRTAAENWYERTGLARAGEGDSLHAQTEALPLGSNHSDGALRYVSAVSLGGGRRRFYFEVARPDGAHDLVTVVSPS